MYLAGKLSFKIYTWILDTETGMISFIVIHSKTPVAGLFLLGCLLVDNSCLQMYINFFCFNFLLCFLYFNPNWFSWSSHFSLQALVSFLTVLTEINVDSKRSLVDTKKCIFHPLGCIDKCGLSFFWYPL